MNMSIYIYIVQLLVQKRYCAAEIYNIYFCCTETRIAWGGDRCQMKGARTSIIQYENSLMFQSMIQYALDQNYQSHVCFGF